MDGKITYPQKIGRIYGILNHINLNYYENYQDNTIRNKFFPNFMGVFFYWVHCISQ